MSPLNINTLRCEALFASALPQSDRVAPIEVRMAIVETLRTLGARGCAEWVAQEYGDYPEAAVARMRWARFLVAHAFAVAEAAAEGPAAEGSAAGGSAAGGPATEGPATEDRGQHHNW